MGGQNGWLSGAAGNHDIERDGYMKKRTLQKMLSGILCGAALLGSSCLPAFAASGTTTITVNGDTNAWKAYRLLNVTSSLKANCGHGSSGHVNSCYIHYYNINSKYGTALRNAAADARLNFDENGDGTVSDNELLVGLQNMGASTTRLFSEKLYPKIAGITAEHTASNKAFSNVPYGYYLLTENGSAAGTTLMMVDAVGVDSITADTKAGVTTVTKKIVDGSKRVDAIDIKKGDTVNYEVTVTLPENLSERRSFVCDIHNTGTGAIKAESLKLFVDGREAVRSDTGSRTGEAKSSDGNYTFVETITQDEKWHCNCGVVIPYEQYDEHVLQHLLAGQPDNGFGEKMSNLKYVSDNQPILLEADDVITLKYAVTYTDSLTTKSSGNVSESWASFTTDGEGTQRAETPHDKVTALTYQFAADKVDANGDALSGADFTLERKDPRNNWTKKQSGNRCQYPSSVPPAERCSGNLSIPQKSHLPKAGSDTFFRFWQSPLPSDDACHSDSARIYSRKNPSTHTYSPKHGQPVHPL